MSITIAIILFAGAFTFSFAGFGFGLVTLPLLALLITVKTSVAFTFPYMFFMVAYHFLKFRRHVTWSKIFPLFLGLAPAMPVGVYSLHHFSEPAMKIALSILVFSAVAVNRWPWKKQAGRRLLKGRGWGVLLGIAGGWFAGTSSTGGPPAVIYLQSVSSTPREAKGLIAACFVLANIPLLIMHAANGLFSAEWLLASLWYSPFVGLGFVVGSLAFRRISVETYQLFVDLLLLISGIMLWVKA